MKFVICSVVAGIEELINKLSLVAARFVMHNAYQVVIRQRAGFKV